MYIRVVGKGNFFGNSYFSILGFCHRAILPKKFFPKRSFTICTFNLKFTTVAQYIELSEFVTLEMLFYKSVSDQSDIS